MKDFNNSEILIYQSENGVTKIDVTFMDETVWLSKAQMAELFQRDRSVISKHIKKVFEEGELPRESNVQILHIANSDKPVEFYNLDVIISVGYRVKSQRGVQFRIWATNVLKEYMIKGFALDDDRLKGNGGGNYWKELLDRIRDIRSSEKVMYRQVLDLYATSVDYNPKSAESIAFFKMVQNKLHYATHGHTAAEVSFAHGLEFPLDKICLTFKWNEEKVVKDFFHCDAVVKSTKSGFKYFDVMYRGMKTRCMFYGGCPGADTDEFLYRNTDLVQINDISIAVQSLQFYYENAEIDTEFYKMVKDWLKK